MGRVDKFRHQVSFSDPKGERKSLEMERVLGGTGGFHGYRRTPPTSSAGGMNNTPNDGNHSNAGADENECIVREQDRFMPIANVIRIMRKILPPHAKISDDAKETIQECVSEYISFITGEANDRCQREQRKTITAEDVLWAMSKLGFDDYIEPLTLYLSRYREFEGDRGSIRGDPLVKRVVDCPLNVAAFGPAFHYTTAHHHHHGFFGGAPMGGGGFMNDGSGGGSGGSAHAGGGDLANLEPYHQGGNKGIGN